MTTMLDVELTGATWQKVPGPDNVDDLVEDLFASDLLNEAYAATIDPMRFDDLLITWQDYIERRLAAVQSNRMSGALISPTLEAHIQRAFTIFERLGRRRRHRENAESLVADMAVAALVIDGHRRIIAANELIRAMLPPANDALRLSHLPLDEDTVGKLNAWLCNGVSDDRPMIALPCRLGSDEKPSCILATRIQIGSANSGFDSPDGGHVLLTTIELRLDQDVATELGRTFALTVAETEVAIALASGQAPALIAENRAVSVMTVRTQIKRILKKLNAATIPDLVRIISGFAVGHGLSRASNLDATKAASRSRYRRAGAIILPDGRRLAFEDSGAEKGTPVLFIHDMLHAPGLTDAAVEAATRQNWRLIAPSRPGFGKSDDMPGVDGLARLDALATDMRRLLDHLEIERVIVVGHISGGIAALRLATTLPERVRALALVSCVPAWTDANLAFLPARIRLFALTVLRAPKMLPLIARAGAAYVDAGYEDQLIRMFHGDNPADMLALRRPEVREIVIDGLRHGISQGIHGFCHECPVVLDNWLPRARLVSQPIHLIHGTLDVTCRLADTQRFINAVPKTALTSIEGVGLHLLYTHWPQVFEALDALGRQTADTI